MILLYPILLTNKPVVNVSNATLDKYFLPLFSCGNAVTAIHPVYLLVPAYNR